MESRRWFENKDVHTIILDEKYRTIKLLFQRFFYRASPFNVRQVPTDFRCFLFVATAALSHKHCVVLPDTSAHAGAGDMSSRTHSLNTLTVRALTTASILHKLLNCTLGNALVKISARWHSVGTYFILTSRVAIFSRT